MAAPGASSPERDDEPDDRAAGTLALIPLTREWAEAIASGEPRGLPWAPGFPTTGDQQVSAWLLEGRRMTPTEAAPWGPWVVLVDGDAVGGIGFHEPPAMDPQGWVELGYGIAQEFQGRGICTQAVGVLVTKARAAGVTSIRATCLPENAASARVLEKAGFRREGTDADGEVLWVLPTPK